MTSEGKVIADQSYDQNIHPDPYFACNTKTPRKPSTPVTLSPQNVTSYAGVNTGDLRNRFCELLPGENAVVRLCTYCQSKRGGWGLIANQRRNGRRVVERALRAWKFRCNPSSRKKTDSSCYICSFLTSAECGAETVTFRRTQYRSLFHDYTLFNIFRGSSEVQEAFLSEFSRLSSCIPHHSSNLLGDTTKHKLFYVHINHSRYAQKVARRFDDGSSLRTDGLCVFHTCGCGKQKGRLRLLPVVDSRSLASLESYSNLDEAVRHHSRGQNTAESVMGRYLCASCIYVVTEGKMGTIPITSIETIPALLDRIVGRIICFALESENISQKWPLFTSSSSGAVSDRARKIRDGSIVTTFDSESIRLSPFAKVSTFRKELARIEQLNLTTATTIDNRTLRKRLELVLASKGIIWKKLSHKLSCYVSAHIVEKFLSAMALSKSAQNLERERPPVSRLRSMLKYVGNYFYSNKERYWKGNWSLSDEIAAIPQDLWTDVVFLLVSDRRLSTWKVTGLSTGKDALNCFPLSNASDELPSPSIEESLNSPCSDYSRTDLLIAVRAFKIIEQQVLSKTKGVAGPLAISLSVAGICEVSPSFVSVLNAMGLFLSFGTTEAYRQKLIAGRERVGAWDTSNMNATAIPNFQFDNWDIKPLHAVKVDGKEMPKVNSFLPQAQMRKRRVLAEAEVERDIKRQRASGWKEESVHGTREEFSKAFHSAEYKIILSRFNSVVFVVVCKYRNQLLCGKCAEAGEYDSETLANFKYGLEESPINFRTLLLSSFRQDGGVSHTNDAVTDQHIFYVEISRDSAADVLTDRRFLQLVEENVKPGCDGRPRYVVVSGDQPSYKYFVQLWLESWRKFGQELGQSGGKPALHE